jgi:hypothetical protein
VRFAELSSFIVEMPPPSRTNATELPSGKPPVPNSSGFVAVSRTVRAPVDAIAYRSPPNSNTIMTRHSAPRRRGFATSNAPHANPRLT